MKWGKVVVFGFLVWLIPMAVGFMTFTVHETNKALFDSIMAVTLAATSSLVALYWFGKEGPQQSVVVGIVWMFISIIIDAPFFLVGGPMLMTVDVYISDIAVSYVMIPVICFAVAAAIKRVRPAQQ